MLDPPELKLYFKKGVFRVYGGRVGKMIEWGYGKPNKRRAV
jgi:hypothetical protein